MQNINQQTFITEYNLKGEFEMNEYGRSRVRFELDENMFKYRFRESVLAYPGSVIGIVADENDDLCRALLSDMLKDVCGKDFTLFTYYTEFSAKNLNQKIRNKLSGKHNRDRLVPGNNLVGGLREDVITNLVTYKPEPMIYIHNLFSLKMGNSELDVRENAHATSLALKDMATQLDVPLVVRIPAQNFNGLEVHSYLDAMGVASNAFSLVLTAEQSAGFNLKIGVHRSRMTMLPFAPDEEVKEDLDVK